MIAAHLCTNVIRKRDRSDPTGAFHERHLASWENCGEERVMVAHDWELAARAFAQLSSRHQAVLELREERGWSYRRIADHEGIGLTAVESVLWRARQALKREFETKASGGSVAGVAAALLLAAWRWWRGAQALMQQGAAMAPSATWLAIGSAKVANLSLLSVVDGAREAAASQPGDRTPNPGTRQVAVGDTVLPPLGSEAGGSSALLHLSGAPPGPAAPSAHGGSLSSVLPVDVVPFPALTTPASGATLGEAAPSSRSGALP